MNGNLTVFTGCMASGKSALLLNRVAFLRDHKEMVPVCLPNTYRDRVRAVSRAGPTEYALHLREPKDIIRYTVSSPFLAIDEAQDLDMDYVPYIVQCLDRGNTVIIAGRDTDFRGEPFPIIEWFMERATVLTPLTAMCAVCRKPATRSQRLVLKEPAPWNSPIREEGPPRESYEPRCLEHHIVPGKPGS